MSKIISLGSALQDIYLVDRDDFVASTIGETSIFGKIEIGTKVDIDRVSYETGGAGTNTAVTFARTGHEAIFLGNLSHDPAGEAILANLDSEGVDTSFIEFSRKGTGLSVVMLDAKSGERTILTHRGASAKFDNLSANTLDEIRPDWLYISTLRGDLATIESFVLKAHSVGCKVMFNPGMLEIKNLDRLLSVLPAVDILLVNKKEAASIVPGNILTELVSHLNNYCPITIITDSSSGGIIASPEGTFRFGIYEDVKIKDATGAGDAFGAGFLSAYAHGKKLPECITFASANSTSVVMNIGAKRGILNGLGDFHSMPLQKVN